MNLFEKQPEFVDLDPRKDRTTHSYSVSPDFYQKRYAAILPRSLVSGRNVVDVGCALGAAGAWALSNGAKSYTGFDAAEDYVAEAKNLFEKYHKEHQWSIAHRTLETAGDLLQNADLVLCAGVIYTHPNTVDIVKQLSAANTVLVESSHPTTLVEFGQSLIRSELYNKRLADLPDLANSVETEYPYIQIRPNMNMVLGRSGGEIAGYPAGIPSIGALKALFAVHGFSSDLTPYEKLKATLPETYNFLAKGATASRFCVLFQKTTAPAVQSFVDAMAIENNPTYRPFVAK